MLASAGQNGVTRPLLIAHGLDMPLLPALIDRGLATLTWEKVRTGNELVEVTKVRITDAGRRALAADR
jgi:hypothetical protein